MCDHASLRRKGVLSIRAVARVDSEKAEMNGDGVSLTAILHPSEGTDRESEELDSKEFDEEILQHGSLTVGDDGKIMIEWDKE